MKYVNDEVNFMREYIQIVMLLELEVKNDNRFVTA